MSEGADRQVDGPPGARPRPGGSLAGQTVVVVGAGSGIGQACALAAAEEGAAVVVADHADLSSTLEQLTHTEASVLDIAMDVTVEEQWSTLVTAALDQFDRIDGLVLAAGIARHVPLLDMSRSQWDQMLAVHLTGAFLGLRSVAREMVASGGGSIVYLASTVTAGVGPLEQAHYVTAKSGALGLVRAAARELGPSGIRVNAVSPGFTLTPMNTDLFTSDDVRLRAEAAPLRRVADVADVARTVAFLLGARSAMMTGQDLRVDGGAVLS